ncbi:MAG: copper resistance protein CopC/CopD [Actinobacteria bacterium]|nr:copper resistance protein CopC/CopD [Actinomycetota bacterium]
MPNRLILLIAVLGALALPGQAWGHARFVRSVPADGLVLAAPPMSVRVFFDDAVRTSSGIKAIRNGRGSVLDGEPRVVGGRRLVIPLQPGLRDGDYTVLWRVLSDDGHTLSGVLTFGVGSGRAPPRPALTADNGPSVQDVLSRFLFFAGLLTAAGAAFFRFAVGPVPVRLLLAAFLLVFIGVSGVVHNVSVSTRFGSAMAAAAVVAGVGAMLAAIAPVFPRLEPLAFGAGLALLPVPTLAGHALDRGRPVYEPVVDFLHLAAASFWLGGLVALGLALSRPGDRAALVRRFSNIALVSVLVLAATGVLRAFAELRSVGQLWSTGYGRLLIVKTALLALLAAIGWLNRYRLVPRLSLDGLRRNVAVELMLFAVLIAAVALLTDLRPGRDRTAGAAVATEAKGAPPRPASRMIVQGRESGDLAIALAVAWPGAELVAVNQDGRAVNGLRVLIGGREARSCGDGCYGAFPTPARRVRVSVNGLITTFRVPAKPRRADAIVARSTAAFRRLKSVEYIERLASSPRNRIVSHFTLERPDRLLYQIRGGADGIVIGTSRWDRVRGGKWISSPQDLTPEPEPIWGAGHVTNAYVLETTPATYVVSFMNPLGPAWFTVRLDRHTLLPRSLRMTAPAHFMTHRYVRFNGPRRIKAPGGVQ